MLDTSTVILLGRITDPMSRWACGPGASAPTLVGMRWIVDAMNVIGTRPDGWWRNRQAAMVALVHHLERWATTQRQQVTVVFEHPTPRVCESAVIRVAHAPTAATNSADDEIIRLIEADDHPGHITVVTSDATLAKRVQDAGASVHPAQTFRNLIDPQPH